MSFGNFWLFPKVLIFVKKRLRKMRSNMANPPQNRMILDNAIFSRGVAMFDLIFPSHFFPQYYGFVICCALQKGNSLNFSKLTLLLSLGQFWCPLRPIKQGSQFFLGHPVHIKCNSYDLQSCPVHDSMILFVPSS